MLRISLNSDASGILSPLELRCPGLYSTVAELCVIVLRISLDSGVSGTSSLGMPCPILYSHD